VRPFEGSRVLVVVTGGIAAYKTAHLVRRLHEAEALVDVVLTPSAEKFVGRVTFEGLTGRPARASLWERPLDHIELGREADLAIVAPATADFLSKMAAGGADTLAAATLLAAACPVLLCPAMNERMWEHPATRRNVETLLEFGLEMVGPDRGELAEGEIGIGRMSEPADIMAVAGRMLEQATLRELRIVVTAGPTRAPIDPVRYIGNRSSGHMGQALAASAWRRGAEVVLVSGPVVRPHPYGVEAVEVETSDEMLEALSAALGGAHLLLMAAAVSDFISPSTSSSKIKEGWRWTRARAGCRPRSPGADAWDQGGARSPYAGLCPGDRYAGRERPDQAGIEADGLRGDQRSRRSGGRLRRADQQSDAPGPVGGAGGVPGPPERGGRRPPAGSGRSAA
jgi:phosphopantothenoylcysteine decarboxylase/phosphopantothenate--cysteine ligase